MLKKIASVFTFVFHPLLIPTYILIVLFLFRNPFTEFLPVPVRNFILILTFICTFFFPICILYYMIKKNIVNSIYLEKNDERNLFYGILFIFYALLIYSFSTISNYPVLLGIIPFISIFVLIGLFISQLFCKPNAHIAALSSLIVFFICHAFLLKESTLFFIILCVLFTGCMGTSQLILNTHTNKSIAVGFTAGIVSTICAITAFYYWKVITFLL